MNIGDLFKALASAVQFDIPIKVGGTETRPQMMNMPIRPGAFVQALDILGQRRKEEAAQINLAEALNMPIMTTYPERAPAMPVTSTFAGPSIQKEIPDWGVGEQMRTPPVRDRRMLRGPRPITTQRETALYGAEVRTPTLMDIMSKSPQIITEAATRAPAALSAVAGVEQVGRQVRQLDINELNMYVDWYRAHKEDEVDRWLRTQPEETRNLLMLGKFSSETGKNEIFKRVSGIELPGGNRYFKYNYEGQEFEVSGDTVYREVMRGRDLNMSNVSAIGKASQRIMQLYGGKSSLGAAYWKSLPPDIKATVDGLRQEDGNMGRASAFANE